MAPSAGLVVDLFCAGGGASYGYWLAGWDAIGVDIEPQPHYPFPFVQADCVTLELVPFVTEHAAGRVVVVAASPPCQRYSCATPAAFRDRHPDLVGPTRKALVDALASRSISAYVLENVPGAPMVDPVVVCGGALGLGVRRHRLFESSHALEGTHCDHRSPIVTVVGGYGGPGRSGYVTADEGREAMGIPWLPWTSLTQAVPPEYTRLLGRQLWERLIDGESPPSRNPQDLARRCACGTPLVPSSTGRWPSHCSGRCRTRAYRTRLAAA